MKEINLLCFIINLVVVILCGAIMAILPTLTRKSYLFGVKIPLEEHNSYEAKSLKKRYIAVCILGAAIILVLSIIQFIFFPDITLIAIMYLPLLFIAVQMAAFVPNWKRATELKQTRGWKVVNSSFADTKSSHSRGNLSELPWVWYITGLIIIFVSVVITLVKYPSLPDRIPTHFDINMVPDAWTDKSLLSVMMLPLMNLIMLLIMWLTNVLFVKAKMQIDPQNPELSFAQHRIYRRRMGHGIGFMTMGMVIMFVLIGFMIIWADFNIPSWLLIALPSVPIVPLVFISLLSGQGGCKIKPNTAKTGGISGGKLHDPLVSDSTFDRCDDKYWLLGMFYHNPNDPACIVEDRFGNNLGFNYSRLSVKICAILALLAFIAVYVWSTILLYSII